MINYELLKTFVAAGTARTFAAAAIERRVSVSAISQQVKALEVQLGVPLFERLGRRVRLTPAGQRLLETLREELGRIDAALEAVSSDHARIAGPVRIGAPRTFGGHWLTPRIASLLASHAELRLEVELGIPSILERRVVDGNLDLAILVRAAESPSLLTSPIATETFIAVAAPSYLAHGAPKTLAEFQQHRYLVFDADLAMHAPWWRASFGPRASLPKNVVCAIASLEEMMELAIRGAGIAILPDYLVRQPLKDRRLKKLATSGRAAQNTIYLAWRTSAIETARMRTVRVALSSG